MKITKEDLDILQIKCETYKKQRDEWKKMCDDLIDENIFLKAKLEKEDE